MQQLAFDVKRAEADIRHFLSVEDWYFSQSTRRWHQETPPEDAAEILVRLSEDADLEPQNPWLFVAKAVVTAGFTPGGGLAGKAVPRRKAGIRAALLLSYRGDVRCIPALCRVWSADARRSVYQDLIEEALVRVLREKSPDEIALYAAILRQLAARVDKASAGELGRELHRLVSE